jgi:phage-related minor tail protein
VSDAEHGSGSGHVSQQSAQDFAALASALLAQAKAIDRLASSVAALAAAVADTVDDEPELGSRTYLDGRPL